MKALFNGIFNHFNTANTFKTAVSSRLYLGYAPQDSQYPYSVYNLDSLVPDFNFSSTYEEAIIVFNIFSDKESHAEITTIYGYLDDLFDDCVITVAGYKRVKFQREFGFLSRDIEEGVWQYDVQYRVILRKN